MTFIESMQSAIASLHLRPILIIGFVIFVAFYFGKSMKFVRLPAIIGFMIIGVFLGPSLFNLLSEEFQADLSFITDIALSFVAVSIGIELSFSSLKKQGAGIISVILSESFLAFILVSLLLYLVTGDFALSILFGAIAPASAPAGTVAVIQEYKAKGPLTKALYAVVGFDDGLGIIIFGFALAFAKSFLVSESGGESLGFLELVGQPLFEIGLSIVVGVILSLIFVLLVRLLKSRRDIFILLFAITLISVGLCQTFHISIILTNMVLGIVVVNTQKQHLIEQIHGELTEFMPLLFVLFFVLAGANLHISALPALGLIGLVYFIGRFAGLVFGSSLGAIMGKMSPNIRKYLGIGILSQAGVAIGLSLIVKQEMAAFGVHGTTIGNTIITTVTATSIIFGIIGPILTKFGLERAGEITVPVSAKKPKKRQNKTQKEE